MIKEDQDRVKKLLTEAVTLLCRSSLSFTDKVAVEGLIGITLDEKDIFLVSIHETIQQGLKAALVAAEETEESEDEARKKKRHRKRRRKRSGSSTSESEAEELSPTSTPAKQHRDNSFADDSFPYQNVKLEMNTTTDSQNNMPSPIPTHSVSSQPPADNPVKVKSELQDEEDDDDDLQMLDYELGSTAQGLPGAQHNLSSLQQGMWAGPDASVSGPMPQMPFSGDGQQINPGASPANLNASQMVQAGPDGMYLCMACGKVSSRRRNAISHFKQQHIGIRVECPLCNKLFLHRGDLKKHAFNVHRMDNSQYCRLSVKNVVKSPWN